MTQYKITGMSCAACVSRVENAVNDIPGVSECSVSLMTCTMNVEGDAACDEIIDAVRTAGYGASLMDGSNKTDYYKEALTDTETPVLVKRLFSSVIILIILMYISMGTEMSSLHLPEVIKYSPINWTLQAVLAATVMFINRKFFVSGVKSVMHLSPNMDTLVALGSSVSFIYSIFAHNHPYFDTAAMIPALITVGKTLESYTKGRTTDALKGLMSLSPKEAVVIIDNVETTVPIEAVKVDDIFVVRPGDSIPVDGIVIDGTCAVDESSLTGESIPVNKSAGDTVSAATKTMSGQIKCRAVRVGEDTTLSHIIKMVNDAAATKAPIGRIADKVAGVFVPFVLTVSLITFVIWTVSGAPLSEAVSFAVAVLVISCPCSLGLATPVAIMAGNGVGAKNGILFKNAAALEEAGRIQIAVFDKTGTITKGISAVTDVNVSREELYKLTASDDAIREDSRNAINAIKDMGIYTIMLSGDKIETAQAIGNAAGVDRVIAGVMPDKKGNVIKALQKYGKVAMTGDGINDAPALTCADVGIAIGEGTDIAIDAADIVLMNSSLRDAEAAIRLGRITLKNIYENLFWAFIYNLTGIPIAAGILYNSFGVKLNPMIAAACMSLSSVCVVANALRLNLKDIYSLTRDRRADRVYIPDEVFDKIDEDIISGKIISDTGSNCVNTNNKETCIMTKTLIIEGMMCTHCSGHVKNALEALGGVESAAVSHETGEAVVTLAEDVADDILIKAVEDQNYKVTGIA